MGTKLRSLGKVWLRRWSLDVPGIVRDDTGGEGLKAAVWSAFTKGAGN